MFVDRQDACRTRTMSFVLNAVLGPHRYTAYSTWGLLTGISAIFGALILSLAVTIVLAVGGAMLFPDVFAGCADLAAIDKSPGCLRWAISWVGVASALMVFILFCLTFAKRGSTPDSSLLFRSAGLKWWQYVACVVGMLAIVYASDTAISLA